MKNEEPNSLVGTKGTMLLKSGSTARGDRPGIGVFASLSCVLTVRMENISANACSDRERAAMSNDNARVRKRWSEQSALSYLNNIVSSLQYCPKIFISARQGRNRSSFFFGISRVAGAALLDRSEAQRWISRVRREALPDRSEAG
jgi:hypothetical protein